MLSSGFHVSHQMALSEATSARTSISPNKSVPMRRCAEVFDEITLLNRVAAMGELTASLAHELNHPLAAILGNAQAASRMLSGVSGNLAEVLRMRRHHCGRQTCGEVINGLRVLLKKGMSQLAPVDLNELVSETLFAW